MRDDPELDKILVANTYFYNRVDTLFIATPPDIYPYVGIGSGGASGVEQEQARTQMQGEALDKTKILATSEST